MDAGTIIADLIGRPFFDGGRGPGAFDCWGLCMEAFRRFGYELPEYPIGAFESEKIHETITEDRHKWQELPFPSRPCLVLMRLGTVDLVNHCGVYLGNSLMLHTRKKTGSVVERINTPVFKAIIKGFVTPPEEYKL